MALAPEDPQKPSEQDAGQQTGSASAVPEWYRRPFKVEQVAPVKPPPSGAKSSSQEAPDKRKSPAVASPDKIPVLDAVVTERERSKAKASAVVPNRERAKAKTAATATAKPMPPSAQKARRRDSAAARNLAIQIVAKLNMELRKCGERALSPATVDRLQYLLREALAQGGSDVDNSKNKKP